MNSSEKPEPGAETRARCRRGRFGLAAAALLLLVRVAQAGTLQVVDAFGFTLYEVPGQSCSGSTAGSIIFTDCWGGPGDFLSPQTPNRLAFLTADISILSGVAFDHVYLSLTEIRTEPNADGAADVYVTNNAVPDTWLPGAGSTEAFLAGVDLTLAAGLSYAGTLSGTGIGGNRLLLDVTPKVQASLSNGIGLLGFLLQDQFDDGRFLEILGTNYDSGLPGCGYGIAPCQYYARSAYEYPTLMATLGSEVTPIDDLAPPRLLEVREPPPTPVPEPGSLALIALGLAGLVVTRRRRRASGSRRSTRLVCNVTL